MAYSKTWGDISAAIEGGTALVLTADEFKELAKTADPEELCRTVDVVTVATFAPMCSSGVFINFGHGTPPIRMEELSLNGVPAYGGVAAVDAYLGATAELPGDSGYGGAHVIEALIRGERVQLKAAGKGTDCYPGTAVETALCKEDLNEFYFYNPRNVYQNYGAAANSSGRELRTYLGVLQPGLKTVSYATSGELSPFLNDPSGRFLGPGAAVWLAGSVGSVARAGTQYNTKVPVNGAGLPVGGARTLALMADAKAADPEYLAAAAVPGYGVSLFLGVGFAIPVLDEEAARALCVRDGDITVLVRDYGASGRPLLAETSYAQLRSGSITLGGREARTACSSSIPKARRIMAELKARVLDGSFPLRPPYESLPADSSVRPLAMSGSAGVDGPYAFLREPARGKAYYRRSLCVDCGACVPHCPSGALSQSPESLELSYDDDRCDGCGACSLVCPRYAFGEDVRGRK